MQATWPESVKYVSVCAQVCAEGSSCSSMMVILICYRFIQCAHQRIHHISNADYDEFVSIVCTARNAFYLAPGGIVQFNELLQSLRRSKSCRKELWQRIVSGLATGTV